MDMNFWQLWMSGISSLQSIHPERIGGDGKTDVLLQAKEAEKVRQKN